MAHHKTALPGIILGHGMVSLDQWNQIQLNKPSIRPHSIASLAKEHLTEFKVVQLPAPPTCSTPSLTRSRWQHQVQGVVKINCDRAIFSDKKKSPIGVVIQDSLGLVLGSLSKQLPQAYTPLEIEAMVESTTLQFASDFYLCCP